MKKTVMLISVIFCINFGLSAQAGGPSDVIVLIDTSTGMSESYGDTASYLTGGFLGDFLRLGDTVHLVSFSREPKFEIIRRLESTGDVETLIGRLLLLYPLAREADTIKAIDFAENYAAQLPGSRSRKIIFVSSQDNTQIQNALDGLSSRLSGRTELHYIKAPVTGSRSSRITVTGTATAQTSASAASPSASAQTQSLSAAETSTTVQTPPVADTSTSAQIPPASNSLTTTQTSTSAASPSARAQAASESNTVLALQNSESAQNTVPDRSVQEETERILPQSNLLQSDSLQSNPLMEISPVVTASQDLPSGIDDYPALPVDSSAAESSREDGRSNGTLISEVPAVSSPVPSPPVRRTNRERRISGDDRQISFPFIQVIAVSGLFILGFVMFFVTKKLHNLPVRAMAGAASSRTVNSASSSSAASISISAGTRAKHVSADQEVDQNIDFEKGIPMLSLHVEDQNTAIGRRNVHAIKKGYSFSVGGGKSDFLIFLVPIPSDIASLVFEGNQCTFVPKKAQYFPDLGSEQIKGCIGKTIRVVSEKNYELQIRIERYEDPLVALNKLLNSIKVPGL